jgi:hypothetical protein
VDAEYTINQPAVHHLLALRCLQVMNRSLQQDICCLGEPSLPHADIADLECRLKRHVSDELRYACEYWHAHLVHVKESINELWHELTTFCMEHIFHWIEVLSLLGLLRSAVVSLPRVIEWCNVRSIYTLNK